MLIEKSTRTFAYRRHIREVFFVSVRMQVLDTSVVSAIRNEQVIRMRPCLASESSSKVAQTQAVKHEKRRSRANLGVFDVIRFS